MSRCKESSSDPLTNSVKTIEQTNSRSLTHHRNHIVVVIDDSDCSLIQSSQPLYIHINNQAINQSSNQSSCWIAPAYAQLEYDQQKCTFV